MGGLSPAPIQKDRDTMTPDDHDRHSPQPSILARDGLPSIAYRYTAGTGPTVVFMPGFRSDMEGGKALALEAMCRAKGRAFLRFDYSGHGASEGAFTDGTIGDWTQDAIAVIDHATDGPLVLVGSSMGGWIMLLAARARAARIAGLVGIAAAPDFTEDLMMGGATPEMLAALEQDGVYYEPSEYSDEPTPITRKLIEEARAHQILQAPIDLRCPVRLLHGMKDPDVPWRTSLALADALAADDVEITLIKRGDHRLSTDQYLARLCQTVDTLCAELAPA